MATRDRERAKTGYLTSITPHLLVATVRERTARRGLWVDNGTQTAAETLAVVLAGLDTALVATSQPR